MFYRGIKVVVSFLKFFGSFLDQKILSFKVAAQKEQKMIILKEQKLIILILHLKYLSQRVETHTM